MEEHEFNLHLNIVKSCLTKTNAKIILLHNPYTQNQEKIIDKIINESNGVIIGKILRNTGTPEKVAELIKTICLKHEKENKDKKNEKKKWDYIVIGQMKPKTTQGVM